MVIDRYEETLKPMHELYIEPSKRYADLIVPQGGHNNVAIKLLTDYIRSLLKPRNEIYISVYKHLDIHHIAQFLVSKYQNPFDHNNITRFDMNSFP